MKYVIWLISAVNVCFGVNFLLNALNILHNSKYSQGATKIYAVLFLAMGLAGIYWSVVKPNLKLALLISIGPWVLALAFLFVTMITSDYK